MRIYLDLCCFNRPFDQQSQLRIRLETEAKLRIQERVVAGELELAWSYMLDYENAANPFEERRTAIATWKLRAMTDSEQTPEVLATAKALASLGVRAKDALHVACAIASGCACFLTTDDGLLKKLSGYAEIWVTDPTTFVRQTEQ
ncbi:MAG: type II toxin-antitoxin system VapC family toxin [Thermoanaerobaculia bacterium]|nr:type II toxin-antitoxin system VapC family toxin [Thermoanaerobaculia bacterium]